jgi:integrase/recombinase XerD
MKLAKVLTIYIGFQQAIGLRFRSTPRLLRRFSRSVGDVDIADVQPAAVCAFLVGKGAITRTWQLRFAVLSSFYRFAMSRGYVDSSPLPTERPQLPPPFRPYIYSTEEIKRLIDATDVIRSVRHPLQADTYRTLLLLLYGTGVRIGEALSLDLRDVDIGARLLTIRDTKFFKTRYVPVGERLAQELTAFTRRRRRLPMPDGEDSAFFCSHHGTRWRYVHVITLFQPIRRHAAVRREPESRYQPRLHDLRHTAAVHRLIAWYRAGRDVQRMLPQLSTYLGHEGIRQTQRYLTMTPELLQQANLRFELYAQPETRHA